MINDEMESDAGQLDSNKLPKKSKNTVQNNDIITTSEDYSSETDLEDDFLPVLSQSKLHEPSKMKLVMEDNNYRKRLHKHKMLNPLLSNPLTYQEIINQNIVQQRMYQEGMDLRIMNMEMKQHMANHQINQQMTNHQMNQQMIN